MVFSADELLRRVAPLLTRAGSRRRPDLQWRLSHPLEPEIMAVVLWDDRRHESAVSPERAPSRR